MRLKRSALAHALLQIKAKQEARFYARNVRRLMRGGGMEEGQARIPVEFGTTCVNLMEAQGGKGSSSSNRKDRRRRFRAGARAPRFKK